ncbi:MAG: hypothetical protein NTU53_06245 [Planctomycetota bacterium]|nr:hypothetical protein [Planctomycetota bacterium]
MAGRKQRRVSMWWVIAWAVLGVFVLVVSIAGIVVYYAWETSKKPPMSRVIAIGQVGVKLPEGAGDLEFHREELFNEFVYIRFSIPAEHLEAFFAANPELPSENRAEKRPESLDQIQMNTDLGWWNAREMQDSRSARSSRMIKLGGSDWTRQWCVEWGKKQDRVWVYLLRIEQPGDVRFEEDREGKKEGGGEAQEQQQK